MHLHAAGCDNGLSHRAGAREGNLQILEGLQQRPALFPAQLVHLLGQRNACPAGCHRNHGLGHQSPQCVGAALVGPLLALPEQPGIQRFPVQGRLEVNVGRIAVLLPVQMGGGGEHQRAGQPEMGKQHLPLLAEDHLPLLIGHLQLHIAQG